MGLFVSQSCENKDSILISELEIVTYLHLGHTRTEANPNMSSLVENIDFSKYNMLWLGGDLSNLTSIDDKTISHVDSIYDLGNPNTLWALGNHDYSDLVRVQNFTKRPPFYSFYKNGLTFIVIDTQDSLSSLVGLQKELFDSVVDTIKESTHLIILHHKLIWMYGNNDLENIAAEVSNAAIGSCFYCINPNNFYEDIYPRLVEVKKRGIEVICLGGDIGFNAKEFEHLTKEGIYFLASGINWTSANNKGLIFTHNLTERQLSWEFESLSEL